MGIKVQCAPGVWVDDPAEAVLYAEFFASCLAWYEFKDEPNINGRQDLYVEMGINGFEWLLSHHHDIRNTANHVEANAYEQSKKIVNSKT